MITREKVLGSLASVLKKPEFVFSNASKVKEVALGLLRVPVPSWDNHLQLLGTPEETAQYYFFLDSINFCFWGKKDQPRWEYQINGEWVGGYYAYSRAIKDAFLRDSRFFDASYVSTISQGDFRSIFSAGRNTLLLIDERLEIIRINFRILQESFGGKAINLLNQAGMDADKIVAMLIEKFPTFDDSVLWNNNKVFFLKRAQILVSDISFTGLPEFVIKNLDHLTVFADYKLPQILESLEVLTYSSELDVDIGNEVLIPKNSQKEIELRASSIIAIEQIRDEMEKQGRYVSINELDWILWVMAKQTSFKKPHHKTLTTFY